MCMYTKIDIYIYREREKDLHEFSWEFRMLFYGGVSKWREQEDSFFPLTRSLNNLSFFPSSFLSFFLSFPQFEAEERGGGEEAACIYICMYVDMRISLCMEVV